MSWGNTTVLCTICKENRTMYGWLPMAWTIWNLQEGLECCHQQTIIVNQEECEER